MSSAGRAVAVDVVEPRSPGADALEHAGRLIEPVDGAAGITCGDARTPPLDHALDHLQRRADAVENSVSLAETPLGVGVASGGGVDDRRGDRERGERGIPA